MNGGHAVGLVYDDVPVTVELRYISLRGIFPGHELAVPVLLDNDNEVADVHVGGHASRFNGDDRGPRAAEKVKDERNCTDYPGNPEKVAGQRYRPVIACTELCHQRANVPGFFFVCHRVRLFRDFL